MNPLGRSSQALAAPDEAAAEGVHVPMSATILAGLQIPAIAFRELRLFEKLMSKKYGTGFRLQGFSPCKVEPPQDEQAAEKLFYSVIPSEAMNLSSI